MNTSRALHTSVPTARRPHLVLVPPPSDTPPRRPPASAAVAALSAGLASGFVLSAVAAIWGGGSPRTALLMAAVCGLTMVAGLIRSRVVHVRRMRARALERRRQIHRQSAQTQAQVIPLRRAA